MCIRDRDCLRPYDLKTAQGAANGTKVEIFVYTVSLLSPYRRPIGNDENAREISVQEVEVCDNGGQGSLVQLLEDAIGTMQVGAYYLVKGANIYNEDIQVWGFSMVEPLPEDLKWTRE